MMTASKDKEKDMNVSSKLFMINKDAVYAMPVAALITVFFTLLARNYLTVSAYFFITIFIFFRSSKILLTLDLLKTAMIMLAGVFIMSLSFDIVPTVDQIYSRQPHSSQLESILLTSMICFVVFIQAYFYSFTVKNALSILRYVFLFQWVLLIIYFRVAHGAFLLSNNLSLGNITIVLLPYIYLAFDGKSVLRFIFSSMVLLYLAIISAKTAFGGAIIFFFTYYCYPYLIVSKIRYKLFFKFFMMLLFFCIAIYILTTFEFFDDLSKLLFSGATLASGREILWPELLHYIIEKPLFGHGINQSSDYIQSIVYGTISIYRNLSSHNIYLEILLRGGILLLSFFLILFYRIWGSFYSICNNKMSRIAASGFLAFLFLGAGIPIGLYDNIVLNTLLWFYWGIASGNTWITNHQI